MIVTVTVEVPFCTGNANVFGEPTTDGNSNWSSGLGLALLSIPGTGMELEPPPEHCKASAVELDVYLDLIWIFS